MSQTSFPQHPLRTSPAQQQVWTVWTMLVYFVNTVYDAQIAAIQAAIGKFQVGTATVNSGSTSVVVSHALGTTSFVAIVTPTNGNVPAAWGAPAVPWISNKTPTQFTINLPAAPSANETLDWMVKAI